MNKVIIKPQVRLLLPHKLLQPDNTIFKDDVCEELCCTMDDKIENATIDGGGV